MLPFVCLVTLWTQFCGLCGHSICGCDVCAVICGLRVAVVLRLCGVAVFCAVGRVVKTLKIEFKLAEFVDSPSLDF